MWEADVQRFTRQCAASGRSLVPGERYYSVLMRTPAGVERRDYSAEAWQGPPAEALGWWQAIVPDPKSRKPHLAPNEVILEYFAQLPDTPEAADTRYVLALFLLRKRLLRQEREIRQDGTVTLQLSCPKLEAEFEVPARDMTPQRMEQIQRELTELLDGNEAP